MKLLFVIFYGIFVVALWMPKLFGAMFMLPTAMRELLILIPMAELLFV